MLNFNELLNENKVLVSIGDYNFTENDLENHKNDIINYYGDFSEDHITNALWNLYTISNIYDKGGILYRVIWLDDINSFNKDEIGYHFISDSGQIDTIVEIFTRYNYYGKELEPYVIEVHTPPKNVKIPFEYFKNLDEEEVLVINPKLLKIISIKKYKTHN